LSSSQRCARARTLAHVRQADTFLYAGFAMLEVGIWNQFGQGWALIAGGALLFLTGGLLVRYWSMRQR
jgi:hypothetical protein